MGSLTLPTTGLIYVDAQIVIYSVDRHPHYAPACDPLWQQAQSGMVTVVSSELTLLETLVGPLRSGDSVLAARRQNVWNHPHTRLVPISRDILCEAARLRASIPALRTPDAIHAATAHACSCALFLTNDKGLRCLAGLSVAVLDDVLAAT